MADTCDPKDYMKTTECTRLHQERWQFEDRERDDRRKIEDREREELRKQISKIEEALNGKDGMPGLVGRLAVLIESFSVVKSIVYGSIGFVGIGFLGTLIYAIGWRVK